MDAPEKIYKTTTYLDNDRGKTLWKTKPVAGAENIEYTRTDAFIEKACEWIYNNAYLYVDGQIDIEDFKKSMKGD